MSAYYNLDQIKTEIKKEIEIKKTFLEKWEAVTFPTKKNGEPFAVLSKNISGATYAACEYALQPGDNRIHICVWTSCSGYKTDEIRLSEIVRYITDPAKKAKTENYMPKQPCLEQIYKYDLDDIKKAVSERIEKLKKDINVLSSQLEKADAAFHAFRKAYADALTQLAENTDQKADDTLYTAILDTVKTRYPYC